MFPVSKAQAIAVRNERVAGDTTELDSLSQQREMHRQHPTWKHGVKNFTNDFQMAGNQNLEIVEEVINKMDAEVYQVLEIGFGVEANDDLVLKANDVFEADAFLQANDETEAEGTIFEVINSINNIPVLLNPATVQSRFKTPSSSRSSSPASCRSSPERVPSSQKMTLSK